MSNPTRAIGSIARRRGGDDWNLTPSAADDLPTARIEILEFKPKASSGGKASADENAAHSKDSSAPAEAEGGGAESGAGDHSAATGSKK